jgi:hypothetical protein
MDVQTMMLRKGIVSNTYLTSRKPTKIPNVAGDGRWLRAHRGGGG